MTAKNHSKTLKIDGVSYDAKTGTPLQPTLLKKKARKPAAIKNSSIHASAKKSKVLNRAYLPSPKVIKSTKKSPSSKAIEGQVLSVPKVSKDESRKTKKESSVTALGSKLKLQQARSRFVGGGFATVRFAFSEFSKYGAMIGAVLLIAGYVVYLNIPNINLRVAANRAGFEPSVPQYSINGYKLNRTFDSSPGIITLQFSNGDGSGYSITERLSDWDSVSLLNSHVERRASTYQTFQKQGLTLYIYNGNNATWVSGGVWYDLESEADLSIQEILDIATSAS